MKLEHITGNTFYFAGSSIVGVYIFEDHSCLLVDSGDRKGQASRILEALQQNNLTVRGIINTHAHADHCTGNKLIQDSTGCKIYTSRQEGVIIENPILTLYGVYSASPLQALKNKYLMVEPSVVTDVVTPGPVMINNTSFTILGLSGHSVEQIGIVTPDGVAFIGDSLISPKILNSYNFLYMADIENQLHTLDYLETVHFPTVLLSHGALIKDLPTVIHQNRLLLNQIMDFILKTLAVPKSREQVIQATVEKFSLPMNRSQYYLVLSSISAFLSYLCNTRKAGCSVEDGIMKFVASSKTRGKKQLNQ
ncbi:MAG: MBL fold metallo-hydrolase [Syntrophomonas sp.]